MAFKKLHGCVTVRKVFFKRINIKYNTTFTWWMITQRYMSVTCTCYWICYRWLTSFSQSVKTSSLAARREKRAERGSEREQRLPSNCIKGFAWGGTYEAKNNGEKKKTWPKYIEAANSYLSVLLCFWGICVMSHMQSDNQLADPTLILTNIQIYIYNYFCICMFSCCHQISCAESNQQWIDLLMSAVCVSKFPLLSKNY